MLKRIVDIDGTLYDTHEIYKIVIYLEEDFVCQVKSYNTEKKISTLRAFRFPYSDSFSIADIEKQVWNLSAFDEYINPSGGIEALLGILTDEQAVKAAPYFKSWDPNTYYSAGDRRRYGEELYKCTQDHCSGDSFESAETRRDSKKSSGTGYWIRLS